MNNPNHITLNRLRYNAAFGGGLWILLALASLSFPGFSLGGSTLYNTILLLLFVAPLVVVPLGLALGEKTEGKSSRLLIIISRTELPAALIALASFLYTSEGVIPALLTLPWLVETVLIAVHGLQRFRTRSRFSLHCSAMDLGMIYILVGGIWLTISRAGITPMNFAPVIVLLTAVHFHYAGFTAAIIAGVTGERILSEQKNVRRLYEVALWLVMLNPLLIAIGITFSPIIEVLCSALLVIGLGMLAGLILGAVVKRLSSRISQILIGISALSLFITMTFAFLYAWGAWTGDWIVHIPGMVEIHGALNVFGFGVCGMIGWEREFFKSG